MALIGHSLESQLSFPAQYAAFKRQPEGPYLENEIIYYAKCVKQKNNK